MEVTRKNFKEVLPLVQGSIDKADFLVIDAEFTGLMSGREVSIFASPQEYYCRLLNGCSDFLLIQFGLCAFYWDKKAHEYMNETYNFYLFPRGKPGPERMFLCQSSSLDFLAAQGFDFNKTIRDGISYMTESTESKLRENLKERQKTFSNDKSYIKIPEENKQQIEQICIRVQKFLEDKAADDMVIDGCNSFIRRLLFQELGTRFKNEVYLETIILENKNRILKVSRITSEGETKSRDVLKREKVWEEFEDAVGFSKVARMISQSEKLVVGHNMLLDVIHTLNHFFQPLPADYESFKEFAHCMFPKLLDTKFMSSLPPFKDKVNSSVLQHLLTTLSEPPFSIPKAESKPGHGYCQTDDKHHEAGYDAYITGLCFLSMHAYLTRMRGEANGRVASPDSALLKPFLNKLYLTKTAYQDSPFMNLNGSDPAPSRDHVFHLTFPKQWQRDTIDQLFSSFGPITVQFLDDTSALVALSRREQAKDVLRILGKSPLISLVPHANYKLLIDKSQKQQNGMRWRKPDDEQLCLSSQDSTHKLKQAVVTSSVDDKSDVGTPEPRSQVRVRSSSVSTPTSAPTGRKRTSSGVFQVNESEPPPKKAEHFISKSGDAQKHPKTVPNGRRKSTTSEEEATDKNDKGLKKIGENAKVIDKFDTESKANCVSAFKESDSWE